MTAEQFENIKQWFETYVDDITPDDDTLSALIELKRVHSAEVAVNCREIAEDANFSAPEIRTADALGVLHDVGRFSQIVRFRTFSDSESFNHGEHGYDIIVKSNVLSPLSAIDKERILN
ncbi:HD domain-containing protein, partial [Candidatus Latescibacterota bacterium]